MILTSKARVKRIQKNNKATIIWKLFEKEIDSNNKNQIKIKELMATEHKICKFNKKITQMIHIKFLKSNQEIIKFPSRWIFIPLLLINLKIKILQELISNYNINPSNNNNNNKISYNLWEDLKE